MRQFENAQLNYLPSDNVEQHRPTSSHDNSEDSEEGSNSEEQRLRMDDTYSNSTDRILKTKHGIKTYSDLGKETHGTLGYASVNIVIFIQQLSVVTAYFFFLNKYFPSYIVLIGIAPI